MNPQIRPRHPHQVRPQKLTLRAKNTADGAGWIADVVDKRCPKASHGWGAGRNLAVATGRARMHKHARFALWKNPEALTDRQRAKLEWIAETDPRLYPGLTARRARSRTRA